MAEIKAGVLLKLKDKFSGGLDKASQKASGFASKMQGAFSKVDGIINSTASNLATLGVSIGVGATINKMITFEDRINKIGAVARSNAKDVETWEKQMEGLSDEIYRASTMPDIKVDASEIVGAVEAIMTQTGDMDFVRANIENIGRAMRAFDVSGEDIGNMMSQFAKLGYTAEETATLMNDLYIQGNKGAFTAGEFAKNGSAIIAAYSRIGTTAKDIKNANAALEIFTMNTKSPVESVTVLESIMAELGNPQKQEKLKELGKQLGVNLNVRDKQGNFKDLNDILLTIISTKDKMGGNLDKYGEIFGQVAFRAISAFDIYKDKLPEIREAVGSETAMAEASRNNAQSLKANLTNLQTAFDGFANRNLAPIIERITDALNWFAEDPERFDKLFKRLAIGFGIFTGAKLIAGIGKTITSIKGIGGAVSDLTGKMSGASSLASAGASSAIPVYVTNLGGGSMSGKNFNSSSKTALAGSVATAGIMTAATLIPKAISDWQEINANEELTKKEKNKAKGETVGQAVGGTLGAMGGMAATAAVGAAVGSVVPVLGTAIGGIVGAGIGLAGGILGGKVGGKIGEALTKEESLESVADAVAQKNSEPVQAELKGNANMTVDIKLTDDRILYKTSHTNNINNLKLNTGSLLEANGVY